MPYFHGTRRERMASILRRGLGWTGAEQNWECERGVYLAADPALSIAVMLQHYAEQGDPRSVPRDHLGQMCVIVIDDSRVNAKLLGPDPEIARNDVWLYRGVVDVTNQPVLDIHQVISDWKGI